MRNKLRKSLNFLQTFAIISSIQAIVVYLYVFFFTRFASQIEYAEYIKSTYIIDFCVTVCLFGFNLLILREPIKYVQTNGKNILFISMVLYMSILIVYFIIYNDTSVTFIVLTFFLGSANILYQFIFVLLIKFKLNRTAFKSVIINFLIVTIGLYILVYFDKLSFLTGMIVRIVQVSIFIIVGFSVIIKSIGNIYPLFISNIPRLLLSSYSIGISTFFATLSLYVDKFILTALSAQEIAQYSVARIEIPFIGIFISNLSLFYLPKIREYLEFGDNRNVISLFKHLFKYGFTLNLIFFTLLFCNSNFIIETLYSSSYSSSSPIFQIIILSYLLRVLPFTNLIVALNLERIIFKRIIIELVLQLVFSFLLLKFFGLYGLAFSLTLILLVWSIPYNFYFFAKTLGCRIKDLIPFSFIPISLLRIFMPSFLVLCVFQKYSLPNTILLVSTILLVTLLNVPSIRFLFSNTK